MTARVEKVERVEFDLSTRLVGLKRLRVLIGLNLNPNLNPNPDLAIQPCPNSNEPDAFGHFGRLDLHAFAREQVAPGRILADQLLTFDNTPSYCPVEVERICDVKVTVATSRTHAYKYRIGTFAEFIHDPVPPQVRDLFPRLHP